jgi:RNA polymerase sigma-70 factor, ECF subfamily
MSAYQFILREHSFFEKLVQNHERGIYRFLVRIVGEPELARDLTQDTFLRAYRFLTRQAETVSSNFSLDNQARISGWLFTIARNTAISELRRRKNVKCFSLQPQNGAEQTNQATFDLLEHFTGDEKGSDIEGQIILRDQLEKAFRKVERQKLTPLLLLNRGFSYQEISSLTGLPLKSVKTHIFRARSILRRELAKE